MTKRKGVQTQKLRDYREYLKAERIIKDAYREVVNKLNSSPSITDGGAFAAGSLFGQT